MPWVRHPSFWKVEYASALDYIGPMLDTLCGPQICHKDNIMVLLLGH